MSKKDPLQGAAPTPEETFYLKTSYEEPVASLARLEQTARFLITVATSTSGVFVAALKLSLGKDETLAATWFGPFGLWAISVACLLVVLVPRHYSHGRNEPADIKRMVLEVQRFKYRWLVGGAAAFLAGILLAAGLTVFP
ncbi:MAG: hypothetical protein CMJ48_07260 [Planctomycetaceae bacterium]|nr:hypothetical protein [Planctomycetaceae bacterium]